MLFTTCEGELTSSKDQSLSNLRMTGIKTPFIIHKLFTSVVSECESLCGLQRFSFSPLGSQPFPWISAKRYENVNNVMQEKLIQKHRRL